MADPKIRYDILANAEGAESVAGLATELGKLAKAIDPAAAARAQALATQLRSLGEQQAAVQTFVDLKKQSEGARTALDQAQAAAQALGQKLAAAEAPTKAQAGQMAKLKDAVSAAKVEVESSTSALDAARANLTRFGISTEDLASKEIELRTALRSTKAEIQELGQQGQAVQRFKDLAASTDAARVAAAAADKAFESARSAISASAAPTQAQTKNLAALSQAARQAQIEAQAEGQAFVAAGIALRGAGVDTDKLLASQRNAKAELGATTNASRQLGDAYKAQGAEAAAAGAKQVQASKDAKAGVTGLLDSTKGLQSAFAGIGATLGAAFTGREFLETITQAEGLKRGLQAVTGNAKQAADTMAYLKKTSNDLGLEVLSAGRSFLSLSAATQGTALEGQQTRDVFEAVSRAMSTLGKSGPETERALQAIAQMASKGTVQMEELRGQLGEALPGALKAAADGAGVTTKQLISMVESGNVLAKDLLPALTKGLNNLYATSGPPDTLIARWNQLKNTLTETAVAFGEGGVSTGLSKAAGGTALAFASTSEAVKLLGGDLGEVLAAIVNGNFKLGTAAERYAEADKRLNALAVTAGLAAPEVANVGGVAEDAGRRARDAFNKLEHSADTAGGQVGTLGTQTVDLAAKFDGLRAKGDTAAEAIAKIGKDFDLTTAPGIVQAEGVLKRLALNGQITAAEFKTAWSSALDGVDLKKFEADARAAFAGSAGEARKIGEVLDAVTDQALKRVGTSVEELSTGFSKASKAALEDVDLLAVSLKRVGASAEDSSKLIGASLEKALDSAKTERAINAVIERWKEFGRQGVVTGDQVAAGVEKAKQKIDDLKAGINSLDEAMRAFGLQTRADAQITANRLGQAYQQIANSANVSLADQRRAFDQWAAAAIAANGGVETEAVKVARAMLEIKESANRAGDGIVSSAERGGAALGELTSRAEAASAAINRVASASGSIDRNNARSTTSPNDASQLIGSGQGFGSIEGSDGQLNIPDGYTFDKAAYDRAVAQFFQQYGGLTNLPGTVKAPDPNQFITASQTLGGGSRLGGNGTGAGQSLYGPGGKSNSPFTNGGGVPAAAAPGQATDKGASTSHTVTVNVATGSGVKSSTISTASAADSEALAGILKVLESSARGSGASLSRN